MSPSNEITAVELRTLIEQIERGEVTLTIDGETPDEVYAGDVSYKASNGWQVVVFNDCGEWDYFDSFVAPDGRRIRYPVGHDDDSEADKVLMSYRPSSWVEAGRYHWGTGGAIR